MAESRKVIIVWDAAHEEPEAVYIVEKNASELHAALLKAGKHAALYLADPLPTARQLAAMQPANQLELL